MRTYCRWLVSMRPDVRISASVIAELVADEHVPYLAALRYKRPGCASAADWEHCGTCSGRRTAGRGGQAEFRKRSRCRRSTPSADFLKTSYWRHRGKLDVPKERFISYPGAGRGRRLVAAARLGWLGSPGAGAGPGHPDRRTAQHEDGWAADRLTPLLAGLREVMPWVRQWHGEFDPAWGESPADTDIGFLSETAGRLNLTDETLTSWRPPKSDPRAPGEGIRPESGRRTMRSCGRAPPEGRTTLGDRDTVSGMSQPSVMPLLREVIEIPERTSTSDFVLHLAEASPTPMRPSRSTWSPSGCWATSTRRWG